MSTVIIDYESGNLHSALKSFQRMAREGGLGSVAITSDPDVVRRAERIVLPGVGAYADCRAGLMRFEGLYDAIYERVIHDARPFMGICVGMQLMASEGLEHGRTEGFGWIKGSVQAITPEDPALKIPHMGWNDFTSIAAHPVFEGVKAGDHAYYVHSYHMLPEEPSDVLASCDYGGAITAAIGRDTIIGTQFHPEKSQRVGLQIIANFLAWKP